MFRIRNGLRLVTPRTVRMEFPGGTGARRSWLRGLEDVTKRYLMCVAGKNLGVIMRSLFGMGKPRTLQTEGGGGFSLIWARIVAIRGVFRSWCDSVTHRLELAESSASEIAARHRGFIAHPISAAG